MITDVQFRDSQEQPFEDWWERTGQYLRAGGGQYEKTFAWHAWVDSARAIEREAIAEPVRLMTEWLNAKVELTVTLHDLSSTGSDYDLASDALKAAEQAIRDYLERMK